MKLISCYIENFGKLNNFTYEFNDTLNIINEQNGWGKSTLATFIKFMFYGLEGGTKRNINENEVEKYRPWNGGKYGGNLEFEIKNKRYKIERFIIDKKESFKIYNLETNLESKDYTSKIGEEIFEVDKKGFERSIYIPQQQIEIGETTDSLSSKLTNLMQDGNDMDNYEIAKEKIEDKMKAYKAVRGNGGKITEVEERILKLKRELYECSLQEETAKILQNKIKDKETSNMQVLNELEILQKEYEKTSKVEANRAKKEHYEALKKNVEGKEERISKLNEFFKSELPEEKKLKDIAGVISQNLESSKELENNDITIDKKNEFKELNILFKDYILTDEKIEECQAHINEIHNISEKIRLYEIPSDDKIKYEELKPIFGNSINLDTNVQENIKLYEEQKELQSKINEYKNRKEQLLQNEAENEYSNSNIYNKMCIGSIGLLIISLIIMIFNLKVGLIGIVIGIAILGYSFYNKTKISKQIEKTKTKIIQSKKEVEVIEIEIKDLIAKQQEINEKIIKLLNDYNINNNNNVLESLIKIKEDYNSYLRIENTIRFNTNHILDLKKRKQEEIEKINEILQAFYNILGNDYEEVFKQVKPKQKEFLTLKIIFENVKQSSQKYEDTAKILKEFFAKYYNKEVNNYEELLNEIKNNKNEQNILIRELEKSKEEVAKFEVENDMLEINKVDDNTICSIAELNEKMEELNKIKEENLKEITNDKSRLEYIMDIVDEKPNIEGEIEGLKETLEEYKQKYKILNKTKTLLGEAKERLATKYLYNMSEGFKKYVDILKGNQLENAKLDINLKVKLEENGQQKSSDYLSLGYKDLIGICMRFAMIDSVFTKESTFIILDDPFVNLDEEKLKEAIKLVEEISKQYQVIYFICHKSRK